jgi:hypothetical protein
VFQPIFQRFADPFGTSALPGDAWITARCCAMMGAVPDGDD